jgi:excisionase family DNA binding protein
LLDLEEAAQRLGRSKRWVRERAKTGALPHVRLDGGALAFEVDDLREFARDRRIPLAGRLQSNGNGASDAALAPPHLPAIQKARSS